MPSRNPAPEVAKLQAELEQIRTDSTMANLATGLGIEGRDKRLATRIVQPRRLTRDQLDTLFENSRYAEKFIKELPRLETKKWAVYSQEDGELSELMQLELDKAKRYFKEARVLARKYGGSAIILGADDGAEFGKNKDFSQPLNETRLKAMRWLLVKEGGPQGEIVVDRWNDIPSSEEEFGAPAQYRLNDSAGTVVHPSRLLVFHGIDVGRRRSCLYYQGWGASVLQASFNPLSNYSQSLDAIANSLQDFNKLVVKLKGLTELLSSGQRKKVEERVRLLQYVSSALNAWLLDPNDEISLESRNFAGVKDMVELLKSDLAASSDGLDQLSIFNESPDGITSGSSEDQRLSNVVAANQEDHIRPNLERFIHLLHLCKQGPTKGVVPPTYDLTFPSLREMDEAEQADIAYKRSQEAVNYVSNQIVQPDEAAEALARDVSLSSVIDLEKREQERKALTQAAAYEPEGTTYQPIPDEPGEE